MKKRVMIGLSGGVDSAVSAYLLQQQGYDVIGGFMRNWDAFANNDVLGNPTLQDPTCPQEVDFEDAQIVANKLGIPLFRIDFIQEYWDHVFTYFLKEYERGRTPNPDIFCNKYIKFDAFYAFAQTHGASHIAMGHYAEHRIINDRHWLAMANDKDKDQTYFLSQISQKQLEHTLFPLATITKPEVRHIAKMLDLNVAEKKDSTGVCFIGERHFKEFLKNYLPAQPGNIINKETGDIVGKHDGVFYYTIGQRKGLHIGGSRHYASLPWFVVSKDVRQNILYVAQGDDNRFLAADEITVNTLNWITEPPQLNKTYHARFRHRQPLLPVTITRLEKSAMTLRFPQPYQALTPGQGAVLYEEDRCFGGGLIDEVYYLGKRQS